MNESIKKTSRMLCVFLLMFPFLSLSAFQVAAFLGAGSGNFTSEATEVFLEDFTTTTFQDAATNTWGWGIGTVTNDRNFSWIELDFYETVQPTTDLAIQGRKVYAAGYNTSNALASIAAYDITDPSTITLLSSRNSISGSYSIAVDGDVAYIGTLTESVNAIYTYNISRPFELYSTGVYEGGNNIPDGFVTDIDAEGFLVYYTAYNSSTGDSVWLMNTRDPDSRLVYNPQWPSGKALGLEVSGQFAYVAAGTEGLYALNVSDKYLFNELDNVSLPGNATDVILDGRVAYVALGGGGVAAVDVADPYNMNLLSVHDAPGQYKELVLQGNTLFAAAGAAGVRIFDVADPGHITLVETIPVPLVWDVELFGGILVVGSQDGIYTFQVGADGGGLTSIHDFVYANRFSDFQVWDVKVVGDVAYIAGGSDGLYTLNVRDPSNPVLLDRWTSGTDMFTKLDVTGTLVHCANTSGHVIFDVADPSDIKYANEITGTNMYDIMSEGSFAHVALPGIYGIGNVTTASSATVLTSTGISGANLTSVFVQGRHAFVGEDSGGTSPGIYAIDIRAIPFTVDDAGGLVSNIWDIYVDGDMLYAANGKWLHMYNISNPYAMLFEDFINWGEDEVMKGVHPFGTTLVAAKNHKGISLIDVTDVNNIYNTTNYYDATAALQVEVSGDYAYVANKESLVIFRLFESAADTYIDVNHLAQSSTIFSMPNGSISSATLNFDGFNFGLPPSALVFEISADGINWETVTPGTPLDFANPGRDLRWRVTLNGAKDRSPHIYSVEITFDFEYERKGAFLQFLEDYMWYLIGGGGGLVLLVILIVVIAVVVKKRKSKAPTR